MTIVWSAELEMVGGCEILAQSRGNQKKQKRSFVKRSGTEFETVGFEGEICCVKL